MAPKAVILALDVAALLAAGASVVAATVIPFWPFRLLERGYYPGDAASSCIETGDAPAPAAPSFSKAVTGRVDPWRLDLFANAPDCVSFDVFNLLGRAQCTVVAPARVLYRSGDAGLRAYSIETPGKHRVRASRHGLSCRPLLNEEAA